ncbi:MAG TPA: response regulator [Gammaproteobacteria bacterium]|nr:response regulator [Gammaproteobacteria bacterium]
MSKSEITKPIEKLLQLQQSFKNNLPERIAVIESSWQLLRDKESPDFSELHLKVHSLVGTSGTYGASMVSNATRKLENKIKLLMNKEIRLSDDVIQQVEYLILQVHDIANKWQPSSIPYVPEKRDIEYQQESNWQSSVYLVEDDVEVANEIKSSLEKSGYTVFYYLKIQEFKENYQMNDGASAIIMDMSFEEGIVAGANTIQDLSEKDKNFPPVIFISVHDDIQARLAAAQVGARRYFTKPVDKQKLVSSLDKITNRVQYEPYRILLIDDESDILDYYSIILKEAGMNVLSYTNPIEAYGSIEYFKPELIVLDLYMPECSGFDLAKVIRQDDDQAYIPIVFLSSELDTGTQLAAMDLGGDDFLMKPVDADYFLQAVTARVKRARRINDLNSKVKDALRESEYRLITLDQHAIISMTDISGTITFANQHFSKISGYSEEELIGKNHRILKSGKHPATFYEDMWETIVNGRIWSGQICNLKKNGIEYWVESTIVPFIDENGLPYKYVSVRTDITEVKQSEEDAQASERRLLEQQQTLNTLTTVTDYILLEESAFFSIVTQRAAETLNIDRVSIWMLDKKHTEIICKRIYERDKDIWDSGEILKRKDYPKYFSALENNSVISASDAFTHPATSEFTDDYLRPLGVGAMLDIPIRRQGYLVGVICCEHVGGKRNWRSDEQGFVSALSDLVSLNIESSERKTVEVELAEAKREAENANNAKSEFLSSMSHELRTPMNAISGFAQLLMMDMDNRLDDLQKNNIEEILNASNHLLELVNEILNLAKIESGKVSLTYETVSYAEVASESYSLISKLIENRNIRTYYRYNGKDISLEEVMQLQVYMHIDRMRFKQIFLNLLSNAVKYNNDAGSITISCDTYNDIVRISIIDTGVGISKENQNGLFKTFNRLGQENGSIEGTGIGLVITKKLVELMGGSIYVVSELDKGSTFSVEFPLVTMKGQKKIVSQTENKNMAKDTKTEKTYTVLYIEDNAANLRLVEQILSAKNNINMISAPEPNLGMDLIHTESPDLILLDINLPEMNGFEVLEQLRSDEVTKNIPVIAVSANAMLRDIEKGMSAGFDDYITKPIDVTTFFVAIMKVLNKL